MDRSGMSDDDGRSAAAPSNGRSASPVPAHTHAHTHAPTVGSSTASAPTSASKPIKKTKTKVKMATGKLKVKASSKDTKKHTGDGNGSALKITSTTKAKVKTVKAKVVKAKKTKAKPAVGGNAASAPKAKKKKKSVTSLATAAALSPPSPSTPSMAPPAPARRTSGMLSVLDLCNNDDTEDDEPPRPLHRPSYRDHDVIMIDDTSSVDDDALSTVDSESGSIKTPPKKRMKKSDKMSEDGDEGWSDHNRWYCNICKDGGELLCCDRCPRAFHMSCLGMNDVAIPDTEWFCKMCAECLDRRRVKKESREKARLEREAAKLERDAQKEKVKQMKEEIIAQKNAQAIEDKAKRVLEMQDRILSRKKIKYKDKEEEKLGRLAEDLAQTVRAVKEKLEKLEKEDAALKKKEEAMNKKRKGAEESVEDGQHEVKSDKPTPTPCTFGEISSEHVGRLVAVWDCLCSFGHILQLSPSTMDQLAAALVHNEHSPLVTEVHMCLLELILEDREEEDYVSDDEVSMDEAERFRYEIQHAPVTVGVPTSNLLNSVSWPSILHSLIMSVPRYTAHISPILKEANDALPLNEYPELNISYKLALLNFLVSQVYSTEKVRQMLAKQAGDGINATKEFNRAVLQDRKAASEEEKKLREKQRVELAELNDQGKGSMKTWLKNDKKGNGNGVSDTASVTDGDEDDKRSDFGGPSSGSLSDSELEDLSEEALWKNEEDLDKLLSDALISRHEYLSRKKQLENQREKLRRRAEENMKKQKALEQLERRRVAAKKAIQEGLVSKDSALLKIAIEKAKECELPDKIIVSASHVLEILESEVVREEEAEVRKKKFNETMRGLYVRAESLGRDKNGLRYWIFRGDKEHLFVEQPGPLDLKTHYDSEFMHNGLGSSRSEWSCYSSQVEVTALMGSLDERHPLEGQLRLWIKENFEAVTAEMPMSRPGLLISDLLNDNDARKRARRPPGSPDHELDFLSWRNDKKTWRKKNHLQPNAEAFRQDMLDVEAWVSKRLKELGSDWNERGRSDWLKSVKGIERVTDAISPLLAMEGEVTAFQVKAHALLAGSQGESNAKSTATVADNGRANRIDGDKSDDDDDDDDDELEEEAVEDGVVLWPTRKARDRWVAEVKRAHTFATLSAALGSFTLRLEVFGLSESALDDTSITTRRAKTEKEKQSRKERAVKKKQKKEEADDDEVEVRDSIDDWEEDCYVCTEGGELLCCDGCPRVFHFPCVGLRRVPRGKTFCHHCDATVKPVFPVPGGISAARTFARSEAAMNSEDPELEEDEQDDGTDETSDVEIPVRMANLNAATKHPEDQWDVECSMCHLGGELLCCDGCPRAFHTNCIGLESVPDDEWFCSECNLQTCGSCKKNKIRLDSHVICGSEDGTKGCERVFHLKCAKLAAVPDDDWYCKKCRKALQKATAS